MREGKLIYDKISQQFFTVLFSTLLYGLPYIKFLRKILPYLLTFTSITGDIIIFHLGWFYPLTLIGLGILMNENVRWNAKYGRSQNHLHFKQCRCQEF